MSIFTGVIKGAKMMAISLAISMKRMEDKSITQLGIDDNNDMIREYQQNNLTNDLLQGRSNTRVKVYAERFFKILEGADNFANRNNLGISGDIENGGISLEPTQISEELYYKNRNADMNRITDKTDNYKLDTIIDLKRVCINEYEVAAMKTNPKYDSNIKLFINDDEIILMENTLQSIHIKNLPNEDNLKLIDMFFTFDNKEISYLNEVLKDPSTFLRFDSISINKGKYRPKYELYDVVKLFGISTPSKNKLCYKVICKKINL